MLQYYRYISKSYPQISRIFIVILSGFLQIVFVAVVFPFEQQFPIRHNFPSLILTGQFQNVVHSLELSKPIKIICAIFDGLFDDLKIVNDDLLGEYHVMRNGAVSSNKQLPVSFTATLA